MQIFETRYYSSSILIFPAFLRTKPVYREHTRLYLPPLSTLVSYVALPLSSLVSYVAFFLPHSHLPLLSFSHSVSLSLSLSFTPPCALARALSLSLAPSLFRSPPPSPPGIPCSFQLSTSREAIFPCVVCFLVTCVAPLSRAVSFCKHQSS